MMAMLRILSIGDVLAERSRRAEYGRDRSFRQLGLIAQRRFADKNKRASITAGPLI
jgi:hypothetical protein